MCCSKLKSYPVTFGVWYCICNNLDVIAYVILLLLSWKPFNVKLRDNAERVQNKCAKRSRGFETEDLRTQKRKNVKRSITSWNHFSFISSTKDSSSSYHSGECFRVLKFFLFLNIFISQVGTLHVNCAVFINQLSFSFLIRLLKFYAVFYFFWLFI